MKYVNGICTALHIEIVLMSNVIPVTGIVSNRTEISGKH